MIKKYLVKFKWHYGLDETIVESENLENATAFVRKHFQGSEIFSVVLMEDKWI